MKPSLTPCFSKNASLYSARICITFVMSISLNVVSIAYVFCELFNRSATRKRKRDMGTRVSARAPDVTFGAAGAGDGAAVAFGASLAGVAAAVAAAAGAAEACFSGPAPGASVATF